MPKYAFLETPLRCPQCNTQITDLLWFHWGYCISAGPQPGSLYHIGDHIRWRVCQDGTTPAWTYFLDHLLQPANIGDPTVRNILVQEAMNFFWDAEVEAVRYDPTSPPTPWDRQKVFYRDDHSPHQLPICSTCQAPFAGAMIEIRDNIIEGAWIYALGTFDHRIDYYLIQSDGTFIPKKEWNDHPMDVRKTC